MTEEGGTGRGILFSLKPPVPGPFPTPWTESQLYVFTRDDGSEGPLGGLAMDAAGNLYGTTCNGGANGEGAVYELARSGGGWSYHVVYSFQSRADGWPHSGVTIGLDGNLYGTSGVGGRVGCGQVYKVTPSGAETTLYTFQNESDGCTPAAGLVFDHAGNLYGATANGGGNGGGVVYELSPGGGGWTLNALYSLSGTPGNWDGPRSSPFMDAANNLYLTTVTGGAFGCGRAFKLTNGGSGWAYKSLQDFTCGTGGDSPYGLVVDGNGRVYGVLYDGGPYGYGVAFQILP